MSCNSCKDNTVVKEKLANDLRKNEKWLIIGVGTWFLLGCYGLYTLISKII